MLQELNTSFDNPGVTWLQQDGKWVEENPVSLQGPWVIAVDKSVGTGRCFPPSPTAVGHLAAMAGSWCSLLH